MRLVLNTQDSPRCLYDVGRRKTVPRSHRTGHLAVKITFLIRALTFGGAERQLVVLAKALHARGHRVQVGVFYADGPLEQDLVAAGIPVTVLQKAGRWDIVPFLARLGRFLRATKPDVVHGYMGTSNYLSLLLKPVHGGKAVWGVRGSEKETSGFDRVNRIDAVLERRLSRFADLIIANSQSGRDYIVRSGFPASKTIVIPNGIDTRWFAPESEARARVRAELGIGESELLIGRFGRLDPQKDYPTFLQAAAKVAKRMPNARFVCVGGGPDAYAAELNAIGDRLGLSGRLTWLAPRADMPAVYNALDLHVSSSVYGEGVPNVVAEAMATGIPAVVTDCGDSAWVVGSLGQVVPPSQPEALAEAIVETLEHPRSPEQLRAQIVNRLSVESLADRTEAALALVAGKQRMAWA
jgi:glycosyltransferase involved in cell wall biosynthesis